jgi:Tfp pilus assembly protein PilZ
MFGYLFTKEKRVELRFPVVLPLSYLELGSEETVNGQTHDISQGGLCLATDREIPIGAQIEVILKMIDSDEMIQKKGIVVWSARYGDDTRRIGIKLQESKLKPVPLVLRTIMALTQAHRERGPA